ncbi:MAG: protein-disulfide reductase DsbD domain-containing protein [Pseudomonadales bacterium]
MTCKNFAVSHALSHPKLRHALAAAIPVLAVCLTGCGQAADDATAKNNAGAGKAAATAMAAVQPSQERAVMKAVLPGTNAAGALGGNADFLPVDDAFRLELSDEGEEVVLVWSIAPDYYLYRHKFKLAKINGGGAQIALDDAASFSRGLGKTDDYFGHVEVFYNQALARIPRSAVGGSGGELEVQYQGCADAGLCYPVQTRRLALGD